MSSDLDRLIQDLRKQREEIGAARTDTSPKPEQPRKDAEAPNEPQPRSDGTDALNDEKR